MAKLLDAEESQMVAIGSAQPGDEQKQDDDDDDDDD